MGGFVGVGSSAIDSPGCVGDGDGGVISSTVAEGIAVLGKVSSGVGVASAALISWLAKLHPKVRMIIENPQYIAKVLLRIIIMIHLSGRQ